MVIFKLLVLYKSIKTIRVRLFVPASSLCANLTADGHFSDAQYPVLQSQQGTDTH